MSSNVENGDINIDTTAYSIESSIITASPPFFIFFDASLDVANISVKLKATIKTNKLNAYFCKP